MLGKQKPATFYGGFFVIPLSYHLIQDFIKHIFILNCSLPFRLRIFFPKDNIYVSMYFKTKTPPLQSPIPRTNPVKTESVISSRVPRKKVFHRRFWTWESAIHLFFMMTSGLCRLSHPLCITCLASNGFSFAYLCHYYLVYEIISFSSCCINDWTIKLEIGLQLLLSA